ncbi:MAG: hypothetical protein Q4P36_00940 [Bowdeniella nasicola]|nr:hypothetical protein [Bowdeniella nasicola]
MAHRLRPTLAALLAVMLTLTACGNGGSTTSPELKEASLGEPSDGAVLQGDAVAQAIEASTQFFASAPAAVLTPVGDAAAAVRAASLGRVLGIPVLALADDLEPVAAELDRLGTTAVFTVGELRLSEDLDVDTLTVPDAASDVAKRTGRELTGREAPAEPTVSDLLDLEETEVYDVGDAESEPTESAKEDKAWPAITRPERDFQASAYIEDAPASLAAAGTVAAAGATVVPFPAKSSPLSTKIDVGEDDAVLAIGQDLPDAETFAWHMNLARSGIELPGGGLQIFDGKRYIALYGSPASAALGVLGEQGPEETIARAVEMAKPYEALTDDTVVPALEMIVTVAAGKPGDDGNYSNEWDSEHFIPLIELAQDAGQYVVLDFQPGRSDFLSQVRMYEDLLAYPNVGVALDPEWRLGPDEKPLTRIGHVEIDEVNEVIDYLAAFTREHALPQKMVILHQFQLQMLRDRDRVDTSHPELALLIHADGQGTQGQKQDTWRTLLKDAPEGVYWGWKNFIDEDSPMLTPEQTYSQVDPLPDFVSYQ